VLQKFAAGARSLEFFKFVFELKKSLQRVWSSRPNPSKLTLE
jgi:hypothetical protein